MSCAQCAVAALIANRLREGASQKEGQSALRALRAGVSGAWERDTKKGGGLAAGGARFGVPRVLGDVLSCLGRAPPVLALPVTRSKQARYLLAA